MPGADWAYDFTVRLDLSGIRDAFNAAGPWQWQARDSDFFGDYLNCRPEPHVWLRIGEYPGAGLIQFPGLHGRGFAALLEIGPEGTATRADIDAMFQRLLQAIDAQNVTETDPNDW